jgi:hypothetical protein
MPGVLRAGGLHRNKATQRGIANCAFPLRNYQWRIRVAHEQVASYDFLQHTPGVSGQFLAIYGNPSLFHVFDVHRVNADRP